MELTIPFFAIVRFVEKRGLDLWSLRFEVVEVEHGTGSTLIVLVRCLRLKDVLCHVRALSRLRKYSKLAVKRRCLRAWMEWLSDFHINKLNAHIRCQNFRPRFHDLSSCKKPLRLTLPAPDLAVLPGGRKVIESRVNDVQRSPRA